MIRLTVFLGVMIPDFLRRTYDRVHITDQQSWRQRWGENVDLIFMICRDFMPCTAIRDCGIYPL